jgi:hypothetical protein
MSALDPFCAAFFLHKTQFAAAAVSERHKSAVCLSLTPRAVHAGVTNFSTQRDQSLFCINIYYSWLCRCSRSAFRCSLKRRDATHLRRIASFCFIFAPEAPRSKNTSGHCRCASLQRSPSVSQILNESFGVVYFLRYTRGAKF